MTVEILADAVVAFLATYAIHSTLLCGAAWLGARWLDRRAPRASQTLLKLSMIGALFTSSLQFALGYEPLAGRIAFGAQAVAPETPRGVVEAQPIELARPSFDWRVAAPDVAPLSAPAPRASNAGRSAPKSEPPAWYARVRWTEWVLAAWIVGAFIAFLGFARDVFAMRDALRWRLALRDGSLASVLAELCRSAGVARSIRLTIAPRAAVPMSHGIFAGEIALPPRALEDLDGASQRAVLAHELAHLVRRDPLWLWIARTVECVFFFQPLHRRVRRTFEDSCELACDAWARRRIGRGDELARALTEVAGWLVGESRRDLPAAAMARVGSGLGVRVERLLSDTESGAAESRLWSAAAPLACTAVCVWAPSFGPQAKFAEVEREARIGQASQVVRSAAGESAQATDSHSANANSASDATAATQVDAPATAPGTSAASPRDELQSAARELDDEIAALETELRALQQEFASGHADVGVELSLVDLEARVDRLIQRRRTLRALFDALAPEPDVASTSPDHSPDFAPVTPEH